MPLDIDPTLVTAVLLTNGEWHDVVPGSFNPGDPWIWPEQHPVLASWVETGKHDQRTVFAPINSVCALAYAWEALRTVGHGRGNCSIWMPITAAENTRRRSQA